MREQRLQLDVASLVAAVAQLPHRFNFEFAFPSNAKRTKTFAFATKVKTARKLRLRLRLQLRLRLRLRVQLHLHRLGTRWAPTPPSIDKSKFQYMRAPQICICRPRAAVDLTVTATTATTTTATTTARTTNNAKWPKTCAGNANPKTNQQTNYAKAQSIHTSNNSNNNNSK